MEIRDKIIANGVRNLKAFGYTSVDAENILTDEVYKLFFASALRDNFGKMKKADPVIRALLAEIGEGE
jgi:hypothetical protein